MTNRTGRALARAIVCGCCAMLQGAVLAGGADSYLLPSAAAEWTEENLGPQIRSLNVRSAVFGEGNRIALYLMGQPGAMAFADGEAGRETRRISTPSLMRCVAGPGGSYYLLSGYDGMLYGLEENAAEPVALARAAAVDSVLYALVPAGGGIYYGGVFPGCGVYRFDSRAKELTQLGAAVEGEDYARALAFDLATQTLYVGVGSHAALIAWNMTTGEKRNILPEAYRSEQFVDEVDLRGGRLYARCLPSARGFVLDPASGKVLGELPGVNSSEFSEASPVDGAVYCSASGALCRYDPAGGTWRALDVKFNTSVVAFHWRAGEKGTAPMLEAVMANGSLLRYDPATNTSRMKSLGLEGCPIRIHSLYRSPDGKIVSSAYILRRHGGYDPATGTTAPYIGVKQTEGATAVGTRLYLGTYPHADIYTFDTARPSGPENPRVVVSLNEHGQDRPFALVPSGDGRQVYIGTLPTYGQLGGALTVLDVATEAVTVYRDGVTSQAVVTLAWRDGLLYGGTTIYGGLGIEPKTTEARLFVWDPGKKRTVFETVPVAGRMGLGGFNFGPDGLLWGWAEGTLFAFDPAARKVVYSEEKFASGGMRPRHFWRGGGATVVAGDSMYGTVYGNVYRLNLKTRAFEVLAKGENLEVMARDDAGRLYFTDEANLHRLVPRTGGRGSKDEG